MATSPSEAPPPERLSHRQVVVILGGLILGLLLASLDQTVVTTALPRITADLGGVDGLSWVVTSYLLAAAVATPLCGKLGDVYGRKRLFQLAIVVFLVGSTLCGAAQTLPHLVGARAVQGLGAGGLIVVGQGIIADVVSPRERGRYQGYLGAVFGASSVLGPLLGGWLTDTLSWRWVFHINLPIGAAALLVTGAVLPPSPPRAGPRRVDLAGGVVLTALVVVVTLVLTWGGTEHAWTSAPILGLGLAAAALVPVLVVVERRALDPMVPGHVLRRPTVGLCCGVAFVVGFAMFVGIAFVPLFLQVVTGVTATTSGLLIVPLLLGVIVGSTAAGRIVTRTGRYKLLPVVGTALAGAAFALLSTLDGATPRAVVLTAMAVLGLGLGFSTQTLVVAAQNAVGREDVGVATSSVTFSRSMGASLGVAVCGALLARGLEQRLGAGADALALPAASAEGGPATVGAVAPAVADAYAGALSDLFLLAVPVVLVGCAAALALREIPLRRTSALEEASTP